MKKIVLCILLVIALGIPAASYWLGTRIGSVLEVQRILFETQYGVPITVLEKKQGVFESTYRYRVGLGPSFAPGQAMPPVEVAGVVAHGPIPFASGSLRPALAVMDLSLALTGEAAAAWGKMLDTIPELRQTSLRTVFAFSGDSATTLAVPPVTRTIALANGTALDVNWHSVTGRLDMTADLGVMDMALDAPAAGLRDKTMALSMQGFSLAGNARRIGQNLYVGTSSMALADLTLTNSLAPDKSFAVRQLAMKFQSDLQEGAMGNAMALQCQGLVLPGQTGISLDAAVSLKNLDAAALDAAAGEVRRIRLQQTSPETQMQAYETLLRRYGAAVAARGPRLALERFVLGLPSGSVEATASVAYAGSDSLPETLPATLARLTAAANLKASQAALLDLAAAAGKNDPSLAGPFGRQMVETALAGLVAQGFAVRDKDGLASAAAWDGKTLTINGKILNPPMP